MSVLSDLSRYFKVSLDKLTNPAPDDFEAADLPLIVKCIRCVVYRNEPQLAQRLELQDIVGIDWSYLYPILSRQRMVQWMAYALKISKLINEVPPSYRQSLIFAMLDSKGDFQQKADRYQHLSDALNLAGIKHAPLKGAFLGRVIYNDIPYRRMSDLDIWVEQDQLSNVHDWFSQNGYEVVTSPVAWSCFSFRKSAFLRKFRHEGRICYRRDDRAVDVHWSPVYFSFKSEERLRSSYCWLASQKLSDNEKNDLFSGFENVTPLLLRFHIRLIAAHCLGFWHTSWRHFLDLALLIHEAVPAKVSLCEKMKQISSSGLSGDAEDLVGFLFDLVNLSQAPEDVISYKERILSKCNGNHSFVSCFINTFKFKSLPIDSLEVVNEQKEKYLIEDLPLSLGSALNLYLGNKIIKEEYLSVYPSAQPGHSAEGTLSRHFSSLSSKEKRRIKVVIGCGTGPFAAEYFQSAFRKVCFIREPVDYALSLYDNICRQRTSTMQDDYGCMVSGPLLESVEEGDHLLPVDQWYVRNERLILTSHQLVQRFVKADLILSHQEACHAAKEVLDDCYFVGITEQPPDYELLFKMLGISGQCSAPNQAERGFVRPEEAKALKKLIDEKYQLEKDLYNYALSLNKARRLILEGELEAKCCG